ncbi:MAG: DUF5674 family protein [Patescibacteria group bacterium]
MIEQEKSNIKIVRDTISLADVRETAQHWYTTMVKGAVDVKRNIIALGGEWHMDANVVLLADGSAQEDVWGFNIYPDERGDAALEYVSLINVRPTQGNRSMEIGDKTLREAIKEIVKTLIPDIGL